MRKRPYGPGQVDIEPAMDDMADLIEEYGVENVENTCIYIVQARDSEGLAVRIPYTRDRVEAVLRAVHGDVLGELLSEEPEPIEVMATEMVEIRKLLQRLLDRG